VHNLIGPPCVLQVIDEAKGLTTLHALAAKGAVAVTNEKTAGGKVIEQLEIEVRQTSLLTFSQLVFPGGLVPLFRHCHGQIDNLPEGSKRGQL
jgi:hypothetical protein